MAEPFHRPGPGTRPHLYRLLRDDTYHTAGTILCLNEDQALGDKYERVRVESDDAEKLRGEVDALSGAVNEHASALAAVLEHVNALASAVERLTARLDAPVPETLSPPPEQPASS